MVAMINNLLQPQITAQLGIAPNDYRQPVIIDAYVPPAAGQSESDPSLYFLDRSQIDYATAAIDSVCGYWYSEGTDLAPVNSGAAECKTQADFVGEVIAGGVTSDHLEAPFQVSSYPGVDTTTTAAAAPQDAMPEYQQPRGDAPLEAEAGEGMEDVYAAEFDENEEKILRATVKAVQSGTLTPLIKEELRCTIQSRRLAAGKGELHVEFTRPVKRKDMTDDERKRAVKRRQQNREAAQRFRQKQKDTSDYLTSKIRRLEASSKTLMSDLKRLRGEKEELQQMLSNHLLVCNNPLRYSMTLNADLSNNISYPAPVHHQEQNNMPFNADLSNNISYPAPVHHQEQAQGDSVSVPAHHDLSPSSNPLYYLDENSQTIRPSDQVYEEIIIDPVDIGLGVGTLGDDHNIDVFYEEEVVEVVEGGFSKRGLFHHKAPQAGHMYSESCSVDAPSYLSESSCSSAMTYSLNSAQTRSHTDSTSSDVFDYLEDDFFLTDDCSS